MKLAIPVVLVLALVIAACGPPAPPPSPALRAGPGVSFDAEEEARRSTAEKTANDDFECHEARVVAMLDRRYSNGTALRYVVEGCGKRGTYLEDCSTLTCRYLIVSVVPMALDQRAQRPPAAQ